MTEVTLGVWAPHATTVDVVVAGVRTPMVRWSERPEVRPSTSHEPVDHTHATPSTDPREVWLVDLPAGTDYVLSVDGGEPRPDPRSRWQPHGVHGPSRVFDPHAFEWTDQDWPGLDVLGKVFYELHLGTFTPEGTLDAAIAKLPYLKELGVDIVELMPVAAFPGDRGWGYDGVSLFAVHHSYGGPEALQRFVNAAHAEGLGVCLDVVYNHFGPAGNYAPVFGPYFTNKHQTPWGDAVNLDDDHNTGVRRFIVDNAVSWITDFHLDCLRLDAVHELIDDSDVHILAAISTEVHAVADRIGRTVGVVAESDLNNATMVTPVTEGGYGMDAQWDDDVHHSLHSYLTGETFGYYVDFGAPETLAKALTEVFVHAGTWSTFRDQMWGVPVAPDLDRRRFVVFTQNHDQVGNRAIGDRPDAQLDAGTVAGGAAIILMSPFTPMLFQGQEWGTHQPFQFFTDHDDDLGPMVSEGRVKEFADHGWDADGGVPDPQAPSTHQVSILDWSELDDPAHAAFWAWHRDLIALRRTLLTSPAEVSCDWGQDWFRMKHGPVTVIVSPHEKPVHMPESRSTIAASWGHVELIDGVCHLGGDSVVVLTD